MQDIPLKDVFLTVLSSGALGDLIKPMISVGLETLPQHLPTALVPHFLLLAAPIHLNRLKSLLSLNMTQTKHTNFLLFFSVCNDLNIFTITPAQKL